MTARSGYSALMARHCPLHQPIGIGALGAIEALLVHVDNGKQGDSRDTKLRRFTELLEQVVDALSLYSWHRRYGFGTFVAVEHEHRVDQIARPQLGFGDQTAQCGRSAAAAHANLRELTGSGCTHS